MDTGAMIASMLVENTGAALMDSGGAYGRAWQHTRAKYGLDGGLPNSPFDGFPRRTTAPTEEELVDVAELMRLAPDAWLDRWGGGTIDTFQWLEKRLSYDPEADASWEAYDRQFPDDDWWTTANRWLFEFLPVHGCMTGLYGDDRPDWTNTYNGETLLDRTLQFCLFTIEDATEDEDETPGWIADGTYVLLQVHGGADVRGGYTKPRLFKVDASDDAEMYSFCDMGVGCDGVDPNAHVLPGQTTLDGSEVIHEPITHSWTTQGEPTLWDENDVALRLGPDGCPEGCEAHQHATLDDDGQWHCPFDGSLLRAWSW